MTLVVGPTCRESVILKGTVLGFLGAFYSAELRIDLSSQESLPDKCATSLGTQAPLSYCDASLVVDFLSPYRLPAGVPDREDGLSSATEHSLLSTGKIDDQAMLILSCLTAEPLRCTQESAVCIQQTRYKRSNAPGLEKLRVDYPGDAVWDGGKWEG